MSGKRVTGLVFIGIALADLAFAGAVALGRHQQFQGYRGAEAVVVDPRDAAPVRPGKPVNPPPPPPEPGTTPIVRFITAEDRVVMAPLDSGRFLRPPPPGSGRIAVLYDPADPQSVILDHPVPIYESALVVAAPSVPFLLIGLALRSGAMAPVPAALPRRRAAAAAAPPPATPARQDAARKAAARATPLPVGQGGRGLFGTGRETLIHRTRHGPMISRGGERGIPTVLLAIMAGAVALMLHRGGTGMPV